MPQTLPYLSNTYKATSGAWEPQINKSKQKINKQKTQTAFEIGHTCQKQSTQLFCGKKYFFILFMYLLICKV